MTIGSGAIGTSAVGASTVTNAGQLSVTDLTTGSPDLGSPAVVCPLGIDSLVQILLHADGSNGSTTITDSAPSPHTWTANGNAQLSTSGPKFGTASMLFDGAGDYVTTPDSADFALGSSDWTMDCWFKRTGGDGTRRMLFGQGDAANTPSLLSARLELFNTTNSLSVSVGRGSSQTRVTGATAVTDSNWHHAAVVRSGDNILIFLDGTLDATGSFTVPVNDSTGGFSVGRAGDWDTFYWIGEIDEFRLSVGMARWTASFTAPTKAYGYCCMPSPLETGSPVLDSPTASVFYNLTASDLTTGSPSLGTPSASVFYSLTASGLTTGSPDLGTPAAAVFYGLTASPLATGSPSLDTPSASVFYSLTASALATGSPELGTPSLSTGNQLTVSDLVTGSPELGSPAAAVFYPLTASSLATGSPALDAPALMFGLAAGDLATGSPEFGAPFLTDFLEASDLATGSPEFGTPALVITYAVNGLTTGSPDLGSPPLSHHYALFVFDLETASPGLDQPLPFVSAFALDLETGAPEIESPVCFPHDPPARPELDLNLSDALLDPIYASVASNPVRIFPSTPGLPPMDMSCMNHTNGIQISFGLEVQTIKPAVDVRLRELALYGVVREDLTNGQVMLWPDTAAQEVWDIEDVLPRPGIWGEASGELRLFLVDRTS